MTARRVIVNADDLGWSVGITDGILRAHRKGIVTSATLAANMPDAERAVALAMANPGLGVGVHLNACQGRPLSPEAARLADADGRMRMTGPKLITRCLLCSRLIRAVLAEFEAQVRWVLDRGLMPTHLDSHRHVHAFPTIFAGVARLARRYGIPFVRWPSESLPGNSWPPSPLGQRRTSRLLRVMCEMNVTTAGPMRVTRGTWGIAHTGLVRENWLIRASGTASEGITEIMVHPGLPHELNREETRLLESRREELKALCIFKVREAFRRHQVELIHYGHLRRQYG